MTLSYSNTLICLNMIVKNESKILKRFFNSIKEHIDCFYILDTGSTDLTKLILANESQYMQEFGIVGNSIFQNFEQSRNESLQKCIEQIQKYFKNQQNSKYTHVIILFVDADMLFISNNNMNLHNIILNETGWTIKTCLQRMGSIRCHLPRIIGAPIHLWMNINLFDLPFYYCEKTHEYLNITKLNPIYIDNIPIEEGYFEDIADGSNKINKFSRDIKLLKMNKHPTSRTMFYLAESYMNIQKYNIAIKYYKNVIKKSTWKDEIWISIYRLATCMYMKKNPLLSMMYYIESIDFFPERLESYYKIIQLCTMHKRYEIMNIFIERGWKIWMTSHKQQWMHYLFVDEDIYTTLFPQLILSSSYSFTIQNLSFINILDIIYNSCKYLSKYNIVHFYSWNNILSNYYKEWFMLPIKRLYNLTFSYFHNNTKIGQSSSPCIVYSYNNDNLIYILYRIVYYTLDPVHGSTHDLITKNDNSVQLPYAKLNCFHLTNDNNKKKINIIDDTKSNLYNNIDDIRIYTSTKNKLYFLLGHNSVDHQMYIAICMNELDMSNVHFHKIPGLQHVEKNWSFIDGSDIVENDHEMNTLQISINIIYDWSIYASGKIIIGIDLNNNNMTTNTKIQMYTNKIPDISQQYYFITILRGSTSYLLHPIKQNELWGIVHYVTPENPRRYVHLWLILDRWTYKPIKMSTPFTFENNLIEYCLGYIFVQEKEEIWITFSTFDCTSKIAICSFNSIENRLYIL